MSRQKSELSVIELERIDSILSKKIISANEVESLIKDLALTTLINLTFNDISVRGTEVLAKALEKSNTVTSIYFGMNNLGVAGTQVLAKPLATLRSINLISNKIADAGTRALAKVLVKNKTVTSINLGWNKIGDVGALALAGVLPTNATLRSINLTFNKITDVGARALARELKYNTTITSIDVSFNNIKNKAIEKLIQFYLTRNKALKRLPLTRLMQCLLPPDDLKAMHLSESNGGTLGKSVLTPKKIKKENIEQAPKKPSQSLSM